MLVFLFQPIQIYKIFYIETKQKIATFQSCKKNFDGVEIISIVSRKTFSWRMRSLHVYIFIV